MVTQCSLTATARKDRDIYLFWFIALASRGYKNWLQFEQHYSDSVFNLYLFSKKSRRQMPSNLIRTMRPWRHNLCALRLVRCKPIDLFSTTSLEFQESYLTTGILPYKHFSRSLDIFSNCKVLSHDSIMLPPRQPRVFARLACWQLWLALHMYVSSFQGTHQRPFG